MNESNVSTILRDNPLESMSEKDVPIGTESVLPTVPEHVLKIEDFELVGGQTQLILTVLYALTAIVALLGNSLSILVLLRGKRSSRELRLFLVNLSLSDILMSLFSIPSTFTSFIWGRWIFGQFFCPIVMTIQLLAVFVSIYTLTIIGVDR